MSAILDHDAITPCAAPRSAPGEPLAADAERIAQACHDMAVRFHRGRKLVIFGTGQPSTDTQHAAGRCGPEVAHDYLFSVPSSSGHRIREARTTLHHTLRELTRLALEAVA